MTVSEYVLLAGAALVALILAASLQKLFVVRVVYQWEQGLTYLDGRFAGVLPPGRHRFWDPRRRRSFQVLPVHEQVQAFGPVEVVSEDRLMFRLTATVTYRITDPQVAFERKHSMVLPQAVAQALQTAAVRRTLSQLMSDREAMNLDLAAALGPEVCGCTIIAATVGAVIAPPEIRRLYAAVEGARLEGLAALERARGEQAALRSLANAARLLKDNPELASLRLLQTLSPPNKATVVLGSGAVLPTA